MPKRVRCVHYRTTMVGIYNLTRPCKQWHNLCHIRLLRVSPSVLKRSKKLCMVVFYHYLSYNGPLTTYGDTLNSVLWSWNHILMSKTNLCQRNPIPSTYSHTLPEARGDPHLEHYYPTSECNEFILCFTSQSCYVQKFWNILEALRSVLFSFLDKIGQFLVEEAFWCEDIIRCYRASRYTKEYFGGLLRHKA